MTGYSSKSIEKGTNYKIIFIPTNLWAIETDCDITCAINENTFQNKKEIAEYWKNDVIKRQKNIPNDLNVKIDEIKKIKLPIDNECRAQIYVGVGCGIVGVSFFITGVSTMIAIGMLLVCFSIWCIYAGNEHRQKRIEEKEIQIKTLERQAKNKENLLNKKMEEIENVLK